MQDCIKHIISEYEDAKSYCDLAYKYKESKSQDSRCSAIYRDLCESELEHLNKLFDIYKLKSLSNENNQWIEYFKENAESLKLKLRQL